jgi:hypothetical protein
MSTFLYNNRMLVSIGVGAFLASGLTAILQHHPVAGIVVCFLTLFPAILLLLHIKRTHGSLFKRETFTFVLSTVVTALGTMAFTYLFMMLFS